MKHLKNTFIIAFTLLLLTSYSQSAVATSETNRVDIMYAGSLAHVMEAVIGPAFHKKTGSAFRGYAGGSTKLANEIRDKVRHADIFISAHPNVNQRLMGGGNGNHVRWYAAFMQSPLAIGYNPHSQFANLLQHKPWYRVASHNGFKLGRTDAVLDPKGKLSVEAIKRIAKLRHNPKLAKALLANSEVFPEETLVGRLQSGQLDAGFFYKAEAAAVNIPTLSITPLKLGATYTITLLTGAPHKAAAINFIHFLLSKEGRQLLTKNGYELLNKLRIKGAPKAIPAALDKLTDRQP